MATRHRPKPKLTHERLLELLTYDPSPGVGLFRWRKTRRPRIAAGDIAGTISNGYRIIQIDRIFYRASRLAWFYVHRRWPPYELDHKDLVRDHDWIDNLRPASQTLNNANRGRYRSNRSGFKGVYRLPNGRWRAMIRINRKGYHIGCFDTPEGAHAAYCARAEELFGEFANRG
jgi:hypothetical protein